MIFQKQLSKEEKCEDFMENSNTGKQHCSLAKADSKISSREVDPVVIPKELYQQVLIWPEKQRNSPLPSLLLLHASLTIFSPPGDEGEERGEQELSRLLNPESQGNCLTSFYPFPYPFS